MILIFNILRSIANQAVEAAKFYENIDTQIFETTQECESDYGDED
jgi:hypothetical protein